MSSTQRPSDTPVLPTFLHRLGEAVMVDVKTTSQLQEMLAGVQLELCEEGFDSHSVQFDGRPSSTFGGWHLQT